MASKRSIAARKGWETRRINVLMAWMAWLNKEVAKREHAETLTDLSL